MGRDDVHPRERVSSQQVKRILRRAGKASDEVTTGHLICYVYPACLSGLGLLYRVEIKILVQRAVDRAT